MFYKTSYYPMFTSKTTPCSYKKNYPMLKKKKKRVSLHVQSVCDEANCRRRCCCYYYYYFVNFDY